MIYLSESIFIVYGKIKNVPFFLWEDSPIDNCPNDSNSAIGKLSDFANKNIIYVAIEA
jgi:hypothetical protein